MTLISPDDTAQISNTQDDLADNPEAADRSEPGFGPVLRNRNFLTLWSGQIFSQLADKVYLVMAIAIVADRFETDGNSIGGWVSAITIAFTIPAVLLGFLAGIYVDRRRKQDILVTTNLLRGGLVFALPPLLFVAGSTTWNTVWGAIPLGFIILLGITLLVSALTQFFAPAEQAVMPLIVPRRHLLSANSLYATTMMASVIIGFAVGEPLLSLADLFFSGAYWGKEAIVGGSYAIAGVLLLLMKTRETKENFTQHETHFWQDLKDGISVLKHYPKVRNALIQLIILFCLFAALAILAVRVAQVMPELETDQFGFLLASGGVGMAIGAILVGNFGGRFDSGTLNLIGSFGVAAALLGMGLSTTQLWPCLASMTALGFFAALVAIPMQTVIQMETPEAMRGKVFGLQNNAVNIALSLPLALAGIAESYFGLTPIFLALAAIAATSGLISRVLSVGRSV
ncbi:MAG: MFS transporter [Coleofasciculaceae cyanobacterium RL_1_1]|nr:MFS transporter [Coleofasciculaceae cyanobacterium RL_1_1]